MSESPSRRAEQLLLVAQGAYFLGTGLWPLLHYDSFERVSGRKVDDWLVKAFGALLLPLGGALILGARQPITEVRVLGAGSAVALAAVDLYYALAGRISRAYLLDAAVELGFLAGHGAVATRAVTRRDQPPS